MTLKKPPLTRTTKNISECLIKDKMVEAISKTLDKNHIIYSKEPEPELPINSEHSRPEEFATIESNEVETGYFESIERVPIVLDIAANKIKIESHVTPQSMQSNSDSDRSSDLDSSESSSTSSHGDSCSQVDSSPMPSHQFTTITEESKPDNTDRPSLQSVKSEVSISQLDFFNRNIITTSL